MKFKMTLTEKLIKSLIVGKRVALAEEVIEGAVATSTQPDGATSTTNTQTQTQTSSVNFESLIAKARQEEKDKLYPEITRLKGEIEDKVKRINELLLSLGEKDETIKQLNIKIADLEKGSKQSESEVVKTLNLKIEELNTTVTLKENEIAKLKIDTYKTQKIAEANGQLIPELVMGTTPEEIDASIELAKQKYAGILAQVQANIQATTPVVTQPNPTIPPVNPNTNQFSSNSVNVGDLSAINMYDKKGREDFAKLKAQLGMK